MKDKQLKKILNIQYGKSFKSLIDNSEYGKMSKDYIIEVEFITKVRNEYNKYYKGAYISYEDYLDDVFKCIKENL